MKALVCRGPRKRSWDSLLDLAICDPSDIVVGVATTTICGSDLHVLRDDVSETTPGTVLGHGAIGTVVEIGGSVSTLANGDRAHAPAGRTQLVQRQPARTRTPGRGGLPQDVGGECRRPRRERWDLMTVLSEAT